MAYKSIEEIKIFDKTSGWADTPETRTEDTSFKSGGPYHVLGYRYELTGIANLATWVFTFSRLTGTSTTWKVVEPADGDLISEVASAAGATTTRREVRLRSDAESQNGFKVFGTYRMSVQTTGSYISGGSGISAEIWMIVQRESS